MGMVHHPRHDNVEASPKHCHNTVAGRTDHEDNASPAALTTMASPPSPAAFFSSSVPLASPRAARHLPLSSTTSSPLVFPPPRFPAAFSVPLAALVSATPFPALVSLLWCQWFLSRHIDDIRVGINGDILPHYRQPSAFPLQCAIEHFHIDLSCCDEHPYPPDRYIRHTELQCDD
ncbi:hypothetical protein CF319_g4999 [Tilletia indica]|nr:hypothetical protein CF319_g4999 [Tilletia indica]